ncbi:MAG: hypothetical protein V4529_07985 [Gemmatimonadota bacterium]
MDSAVFGKQIKVFFGAKTEVNAVYALVEAAELIPSHDWGSLQRDSRYPRALQGRAYSGQFGLAAAAVVATELLQWVYVLDPTKFPWGGPPICLGKGDVLAGNQRAILLQRAALRGDARHVAAYEKYRAELFATLDYWGVGADAAQSLSFPVLVRILDEEQWKMIGDKERERRLRRLNMLSDRAPTKAYDVLSDGIAMAYSVLHVEGRSSRDTIATLARLVDGSSLDDVLSGSRGYEIVSTLTNFGALTSSEHPSLIEPATKRLSSAGRSRVTWMIRALVVNDRTVLGSTSDQVLQKLDRSWANLLTFAHGEAGDLVRTRLFQAFERLGTTKAEGGRAAAHGEPHPRLRTQAEPNSRLLAECLESLGKEDVAGFMAKWLPTLMHADAETEEPVFTGFEIAREKGEIAERAVLEDALLVIQRRGLTRTGRQLPYPEDYLSPTEWAALEPLMPRPTTRQSPAKRGGRPTHSNQALAAAFVYAFEIGATPATLFSVWGEMPTVWTKRGLVCRRTTLQRRLALFDTMPERRAEFFALVAEIAAGRGSNRLR